MGKFQGWDFALKRVTMSDLPFKKEQCEWFACKKTSDLTVFFHFLCPRVNCSCRFLLIVSYLKRDLSDVLLSLFTKEQSERFAQVAGNKRATVSHWLTLLFKKERKCDFLKNERIALLLFCSQKPMSEFPTLGNSRKFNFGPKSYWSLF